MTSKLMAAEASKKTFFSLYEVDFEHPLGSGAYGDVYLCRERGSGEECALKKIPKEFTEHVEFQREMNALLHIRSHGGHPNICMLRENFDDVDDYLLVLDLVMGKEMFDHLIEHGAYSEADASRLVRQVASALDFIHGIGVVHADLKPENIMLRSTRGNAFIKVIDFGCSEVLPNQEEEDIEEQLPPRALSHKDGATTAYCGPEAFSDETVPLHPSADMWALGVIVYMMLIGRHPFDLECDASDDEIAKRIKEQRLPSFDVTRHLSASAMDLLSKLMDPDPKKANDST
jgi:serine/threonine protein kinase